MIAAQFSLVLLLVVGAQCESAERYMEYIVGRHNNFRQGWFNGREWDRMEWDNSLAEEADRRMSQCNMGNGYYSSGMHYAYYNGGDNFYNVRRTFNDWYNGMSQFDWKNNEGNFYQMDWYRSRSVGCAMNWCPSFNANGQNYQNMWFFGCYYEQREYNDNENEEFFGQNNWNGDNFNGMYGNNWNGETFNGMYGNNWNGDNFNGMYGNNWNSDNFNGMYGNNWNGDNSNGWYGNNWNGNYYKSWYGNNYMSNDYYNNGYYMNYNNGYGYGDNFNGNNQMNNGYYNNYMNCNNGMCNGNDNNYMNNYNGYGNNDYYMNNGYYQNGNYGNNYHNRGYYMDNYYNNNGNGYMSYYNNRYGNYNNRGNFMNGNDYNNNYYNYGYNMDNYMNNGYGNGNYYYNRFYMNNDFNNGYENMEENMNCEDRMPNCDENMCKNNMFYMRFQCRMTCGYCS